MNFTLVKIRLIQLKREASALGLIYSVLVFLVCVAAVIVFFSAFNGIKSAAFACGVFSVLLFSIHNMRTDKTFVQAHLANPYHLMWSEYFVFTLPFTLPVLFTHYWFLFFILIAAVSIAPLINVVVKQRTTMRFLERIISIDNYEWISGFRKSYPVYTVIYLLALSLSWIKIVPLFLIWLLTASVTSFYVECESLQLLFLHKQNAASFLKMKMKAHSLMLFFFIVPIAFINFIFNMDYLWIILLILFMQLAILNFSILFKYSVYEPSQKADSNSVINALVAFSGLIPFLLPLPLLMCFRNYFIAKRNLQNYLHD